MAQQLTFDLPYRAAMGRDDFFVSGANAAAVAQIDAWRDWPLAKLVLCGDAASGKTHLVHVWAAQAGADIVEAAQVADHLDRLLEAPALAVENADRICDDAGAEEALFHLHNAMGHRGAPLLLTARAAPSRWGIKLPDLASRMAQAGVAKLDPPDDTLLMAVIMKRAHDLQMPLSATILTYVAPRLERSFASADRLVDQIAALSLSEKRKPTLTHAKQALAAPLGQTPPLPSS